MASISVDVDIDLSEFSTDELAEELYDRIQARVKRSHADDKHLKRLLDLITALNDQFFGEDDEKIILPQISLADTFKAQHMEAVFEKYTLSEIEKALPI